MSIIDDKPRRRAKDAPSGPRDNDPRVIRSRGAVADAARTLFLRRGYAGTTMDEIAALAGLTKRTLYNVHGDKQALFTRIATEVMAFADAFVADLRKQAETEIEARELRAALDDLGRRLALGIMQPEVIALRRLLIGEARLFPSLAPEYFDRAPGRVVATLASWFERLDRAGLLRAADPRRAAAQFAYLVVGELLDRAVLVGTVPARGQVLACAREGVETFLARYATTEDSR